MPKIFVLETNKVFDSVAAAARSVGVDASNAAKVIKGKRGSAGGYHFIGYEQRSDLERSLEGYKEYIRTREKTKVLVKAERNQRRNLIDNVHDLLVDVNKRMRNAKKEGLFDTDPVLQKMISYTDYYGMNKTGGYDTTKANLRTFTNQELQNLADMIERDKGQYAQDIYDRMSRHRNIATYAAQFGITVPEAKKYFNLYPVLFELFAAAKQGTEYNYNEIEGELYDAMQGDATEDQLLDFILDLKSTYQGNTKQSLDDILQKWSKQRKQWQANFESKKKLTNNFGGEFD